MKCQCVRSSDSNANVAFCRCSGDRLPRNEVAAVAMEADDRSAATSPPASPAATQTAANRTRGARRSCMEAPPQQREFSGTASKMRLQQVTAPSALASSETSTVRTRKPARSSRSRVRGKASG